ncbi:MAG: Hsp70 family protein [Thermoguttaceae bacterium]|nr:Hsp70 family protein [Thermoguttaceae bacterium]
MDTTTELPRFIVGIDLGTTNSAVCYLDTQTAPSDIRLFSVPQLVAPGVIESRDTLPSCVYCPSENEFPPESLALPWTQAANDEKKRKKQGGVETSFVGVFARDYGCEVSGHLITSSKSWLCHGGVDRTSAILPWNGSEEIDKSSPVDASAKILSHIRAAWNARFPDQPLELQEIVLTLPASFDEVARELTVKAAARAGLPKIILIEEPQAAFYAWMNLHPQHSFSESEHSSEKTATDGTLPMVKKKRKSQTDDIIHTNQKILVCDIGGGTSDFTLIQTCAEADGRIRFHRVAVGEHLILGGDNNDLALAKYIEDKLTEHGKKRLDSRVWTLLIQKSRAIKEILFSDTAPASYTVHLNSGGRKLLSSSMTCELNRDEVRQFILDGFFPQISLDTPPQRKRVGFQEFGLPYATDPAITKHLASFLTAHRHVTIPGMNVTEEPSSEKPLHDPARPDVILFNGGLFESSLIRQRVVEMIQDWFRTKEEPNWSPIVLTSDRLDLAVARGAVYYGNARRGHGTKISAQLARTYYIGVDTNTCTEKHADQKNSESSGVSMICLVPAGMEPGAELVISHPEFDLRLAEPVEFPLYVSSTRLTDSAGEVFQLSQEQVTPLAPIRTVLKSGKKQSAETIRVQLTVRLSEIGTLQLGCKTVDQTKHWRLEFDVRSATQTDIQLNETTGEHLGIIDESAWNQCQQILSPIFGPSPTTTASNKPCELMNLLVNAMETPRDEWIPSLLRRIWSQLIEWETSRKKSAQHEARWLNLLGFSLRPGYGVAVDDWRVEETWKYVQGKLIHGTPSCRIESFILWRRIAGGLSAGRQQTLAEPILKALRQFHSRLTSKTGQKISGNAEFGQSAHEASEMLRMLGAFEQLSTGQKISIGEMLLEIQTKKKCESMRSAIFWTLGRLGSRNPAYGSLANVIPQEIAEKWLKRLMSIENVDSSLKNAMVLCSLCTDDRWRDISLTMRKKVVQWCREHAVEPEQIEHVLSVQKMEESMQTAMLGDALPRGLRIR